MATSFRQHSDSGVRGAGGSDPTRVIHALWGAVVIEGLALGVIVGLNGALPWQVARVLVVGTLTALALWALTVARPGIRAVVALSAGLVGTVVGIGIGIMHITHDTVNVTAVAGIVGLVSGLFLLAIGSVAAVRALPGWWKLLTVPIALALLLFVL